MKTRNYLAVTVALSALMAVPALAEEEPIRVGVVYPLTGPGTVFGSPALLGHEIAVDIINERGGILGRRVVSSIRDSKLNPAEATAVTRDLITRDGVDFILGGVSSAEGLAISEVAREEQTIYIATVPKTVQMSQERFHPYMFRVAANTNTEGKSAAIIMDELGVDRICTILLDYSYGHDLGTAFEEHIRQLRPNAEIVIQVWPQLGATDYTPYITEVMQAGCDGVFSGIWGGPFPAFAKQAEAFGFFDQFEYVSAGEVASVEVAKEMGADMPDGIWSNSYEVFYYPQTEEHLAYVAALRERTGEEHPASWPSTGYIGMQFLAAAIEKAGTTDTEAVAEALRGLTVDTPIGPLTIRESDQQANRGQFWGQVNSSDEYPFKIMNPVRYIPADDIMD